MDWGADTVCALNLCKEQKIWGLYTEPVESPMDVNSKNVNPTSLFDQKILKNPTVFSSVHYIMMCEYAVCLAST